MLISLSFSLDIFAQTQEQPPQMKASKAPLLIASPNTCELEKGTYLCEIKAALIWEVADAGHYCLFELDENTAIKCWPNAWSGRHVLSFQSNKTVTYQLRKYNSDVDLVSTSINVIGTLEQRMRAKRRSRFFRIF